MDDREKLQEALRRAAPVSRMIDYGMDEADARHVHAATAAGADWVDVLTALAQHDEEAARNSVDGADLWHRAAVSLIFAQLIDNFDVDRKVVLNRRMSADFGMFTAGASLPIRKIEIDFVGGSLFGWHVKPLEKSRGAVVVFGGLSGWATAYRSIAEALAREGLECILADGPGQGETRMEGKIFAGKNTVPGFGRFLDYLASETEFGRFGIWGNSFGGLFAALTTSSDERVGARCINGAPARVERPPFRTPAEQLAAIFGGSSLDECGSAMESLTFDPDRLGLKCPVKVVEGGADPLVPLGAQDIFLANNRHPMSGKLSWADGEHTIYNHAAERNRLVSSWFAQCLI